MRANQRPFIFVAIPAFRPGEALRMVVASLLESNAFLAIVDDGSGPAYRPLFDALEQLPGVQVLRHAVNLGKGAALKTALNYFLARYPDCEGIVTADADGQHHADDILAVAAKLAETPDALVLGVRQFSSTTPLRSRIGNQLTRSLFRLVQGTALDDTQTGLRGIPRRLAEKLLRVDSRGYEFELDMLIMTKHLGIPIAQVPIRTIYIEENISSHFNPLLDSMRIYFVLLRFAMASALTAIVDNLLFYFTFQLQGNAAAAQVVARSVAIFVNYRLNRNIVFHSEGAGASTWLRFVGVVVVSGAASYAILYVLQHQFGWQVMTAKLTAECILFLFNFAFLRDFVFTQPQTTPQATDWSQYYQSVPATAKITRRYTTRTILAAVETRSFPAGEGSMLEFGGANSCFADALVQQFQPTDYHVADTNQYGLDLLKDRQFGSCRLHLHNADILRTQLPQKFDLVYSIGLIEHFDHSGTAEAIQSHFRHVKPGGLVLISFPRPTFLYRIVRGFLEIFGLWKFPDERPLQPREVLQSVQGHGTVLSQKTLWPLMLTQHMIVVRANGA